MIDLYKVVKTFSIGLLLGVTAPAHAQKLPASVTIGTNPAGTVFYAVGAGLAKTVSSAGPMSPPTPSVRQNSKKPMPPSAFAFYLSIVPSSAKRESRKRSPAIISRQ